MNSNHNLIALDIGEKRVGVAMTNTLARLAHPLATLERGDDFWESLQTLITGESVEEVVIGLPRNLNGDDTDQTKYVRDFVDEFKSKFDLPVVLQDEALTSRKAEDELKSRGKPFAKGDVDALAATFILEDYLSEKGI